MSKPKDKPPKLAEVVGTVADLVRSSDGLRNAEVMLGGEENQRARTDPKLRAAVAREVVAVARKRLKFDRTGTKNQTTPTIEKHIKQLVMDNREAGHERIYQLADRSIIGDMPRDTLKRYVTATWEQLGIKRRPGRPRR